MRILAKMTVFSALARVKLDTRAVCAKTARLLAVEQTRPLRVNLSVIK